MTQDEYERRLRDAVEHAVEAPPATVLIDGKERTWRDVAFDAYADWLRLRAVADGATWTQRTKAQQKIAEILAAAGGDVDRARLGVCGGSSRI